MYIFTDVHFKFRAVLVNLTFWCELQLKYSRYFIDISSVYISYISVFSAV